MSMQNIPIGRKIWEKCPKCARKGWYWLRQYEQIMHRCKYCEYTERTVTNVAPPAPPMQVAPDALLRRAQEWLIAEWRKRHLQTSAPVGAELAIIEREAKVLAEFAEACRGVEL